MIGVNLKGKKTHLVHDDVNGMDISPTVNHVRWGSPHSKIDQCMNIHRLGGKRPGYIAIDTESSIFSMFQKTIYTDTLYIMESLKISDYTKPISVREKVKHIIFEQDKQKIGFLKVFDDSFKNLFITTDQIIDMHDSGPKIILDSLGSVQHPYHKKRLSRLPRMHGKSDMVYQILKHTYEQQYDVKVDD